MDLELSDEQRWLSESVQTLLTGAWTPAPGAPLGTEPARAQLWRRLVDFGALSVGGQDGLGAIELCLIARALGAHLAPVPFLGSAAARFAAGDLDALAGEDAVAAAVLEPGAGWSDETPATALDAAGVVSGRKVAVAHAGAVARLAVVVATSAGPALALVLCEARGLRVEEQPSFDATTPLHAVALEAVAVAPEAVAGHEAVDRLMTIGALLAAADAVGAAGRLLQDACAYAAERRQFGRPIGSFQALRHLLADMYVRQASAESSVLYAAAALDEGLEDARRTASIAKAYVSRATREVAHGAIQVFGGVAITDEHPAHRYLRRIVVCEQQFGDAAHHERVLGRALAAGPVPEPVS